MGQNGNTPKGPRCIALVGPFQSGKTTLLDAILARTGGIARQGSVDAGTSIGDSSKEARAHKMSVEATFATTTFMGDSYTFVDCPGSVEFIHDMRAVLPAVDAAVVVCEADEKKVPQLQLIMRELEDQNIPRFLYLNKIDKADKRVRETVKLLQPASRVPLLLRQIPIWNGDLIAGFVDLALERAFVYKEQAPSEIIDLKGEDLDREKEEGYRQRSERPPFRRHQRLNREHTGGIAGISRFHSVNNHNRTAGESRHVGKPLAVPAESGRHCAQQDVDADVSTLPEQPRCSEHCD